MAFYNLQKIQTEVLNRMKTHSQLVSQSRITDWSNLAQDELVTEFEPDHLQKEINFSTVINQREYFFELEFNKILSVTDVASNFPLDNVTRADEELVDPNRDDQSSNPYAYIVGALSWVKAQPTSASVITVSSSSTSDVAQQVRINGIVAGEEDSELFTLNGTTAVVGTKSFTEVFTVAKGDTTEGNVTVTAAAVTITTIPAKALSKQYQPIILYPIPSAVEAFRVRGIRRPRQLVYKQDFPDLPEIYHELIILGAVIRGHNDLFKPTLAEAVRTQEYEPMREKLKAQMGQNRSKRSRKVLGVLPTEPLFDKRNRLIKRVPSLIG